MHYLRTLFFALAVALICSLSLPGTGSAGIKEPFKCSMCHWALPRGVVVHKPVGAGNCLKCHEQFSENHPLGKGSVGFVVPKEKLCATCHGRLVQKQFLHKPVGRGECTLCHMPHTSPNKSLLKDTPPKLCFRCHPEEKFNGSYHHPPVKRGECLSCHDPHQADTRYLLRKPGSELCFTCHDPKLAKGESVHPPVAQGKCTGCHEPHASAYRKILKADLPDALYRTFGPDAFPLCFTCHKPELVSEVKTTTATNFRNGDRNLHAVHVKKVGKGRSCKICHNPHASAQDHLINPKSPGFGTWSIPIRYHSTPTGGGCTVGCHKTFRYDRVNPVVQ